MVWVPMLGAREEHVGPATGTIRRLPTRHYWDGEGLLVDGYRAPLELAGPAWDIYLLYGPDVIWPEGSLPRPAFWMHQLGAGAPGPRLDRDVFAARAARLLE